MAEFTPSEADFIIRNAQATKARWERVCGDAESHKDIVKRDNAIDAMAALDALIEKVRRLSYD